MSTCTNAKFPRIRNAFTLLEILIVVIILGILAAIVIPQFSTASTQTRASALQDTVGDIRSQIAEYKLQHGGEIPNLVGSTPAAWLPLTATSTCNGATVGPYVTEIPFNPMTGGFAVGDGTPTSTGFKAGVDFLYDYNGGNGSGNLWGQTSSTAGGTILP